MGILTKNSLEKSNAPHMPGVPPSGLTLIDAKRFTEVSLGRRRPGLNKARSDRKPTRRDMLFAVVADKLDLYSAERGLEKEICSFYCVLFS